jgi:transposase-like protein
MSDETEISYTWVLSKIKERGIKLPVIVTDCCNALMNSIKCIYPGSLNVLCQWHMDMNLVKNLKNKIISSEDWEDFMSAVQKIIKSTTENEYQRSLEAMKSYVESVFSSNPEKDYGPALRYLENTWLQKKNTWLQPGSTEQCI